MNALVDQDMLETIRDLLGHEGTKTAITIDEDQEDENEAFRREHSPCQSCSKKYRDRREINILHGNIEDDSV